MIYKMDFTEDQQKPSQTLFNGPEKETWYIAFGPPFKKKLPPGKTKTCKNALKAMAGRQKVVVRPPFILNNFRSASVRSI